MMRTLAALAFFYFAGSFSTSLWAQAAAGKVAAAFRVFQEDGQVRNAISSLYVVNAKTGQVVFDVNGEVGLAPASTQKVITSISAYELLGAGYRYQTAFGYQKKGDAFTLYVMPSGDPSFGSWRWASTNEDVVMAGLTKAAAKLKIPAFAALVVDNSRWNVESIPDGWMWQDVGNYYGAGPAKLNWRENQFDLLLRSGSRIGDPVWVVNTVPTLHGYALRSELTAAAAGTGDQAYIYFPLTGAEGVVRGTIPIKQSAFKISGALPDPAHQWAGTLAAAFRKVGLSVPTSPSPDPAPVAGKAAPTVFHTVSSPPLDSLVFWFNRKSINLYGEALVKTIAFEQGKEASTQNGVELIQAFWQKQGLSASELNIVDGSGLSPLNRMTTHAQVRVLQYALNQPWYRGFYLSLPVYNGMKMKSGTIRNVKGFCGYHTASDGNQYVFSFLVNNYQGSSASLVQKMYKVLDGLK